MVPLERGTVSAVEDEKRDDVEKKETGKTVVECSESWVCTTCWLVGFLMLAAMLPLWSCWVYVPFPAWTWNDQIEASTASRSRRPVASKWSAANLASEMRSPGPSSL